MKIPNLIDFGKVAVKIYRPDSEYRLDMHAMQHFETLLREAIKVGIVCGRHEIDIPHLINGITGEMSSEDLVDRELVFGCQFHSAEDAIRFKLARD